MPAAEAASVETSEALRLLDGFGLNVEVALAEAGRLRTNLFIGEVIAAGRWLVALARAAAAAGGVPPA